MLVIFGSAIGFWFLYLIIALFAQHRKALIATSIIGIVAGTCALIAGGDEANTLGGALLFWFLTSIIPQLQVNNEENEKSEQNSNSQSKTASNKQTSNIELSNFL